MSITKISQEEETALVEWLEEVNQPIEYPDGVS
jgi:hypothetical protein